jgi:hypothetical protein
MARNENSQPMQCSGCGTSSQTLIHACRAGSDQTIRAALMKSRSIEPFQRMYEPLSLEVPGYVQKKLETYTDKVSYCRLRATKRSSLARQPRPLIGEEQSGTSSTC